MIMAKSSRALGRLPQGKLALGIVGEFAHVVAPWLGCDHE